MKLKCAVINNMLDYWLKFEIEWLVIGLSVDA
jgi:hypothetical protein